jgi:hypothetical protein
VAGWCKGELLFSVIQVGSYVNVSWCFHPVCVGTLRELVLPSTGCYRNQGVGASFSWVLEKPGSWCFLLVGAKETRKLVLPSSGC